MWDPENVDVDEDSSDLQVEEGAYDTEAQLSSNKKETTTDQEEQDRKEKLVNPDPVMVEAAVHNVSDSDSRRESWMPGRRRTRAAVKNRLAKKQKLAEATASIPVQEPAQQADAEEPIVEVELDQPEEQVPVPQAQVPVPHFTTWQPVAATEVVNEAAVVQVWGQHYQMHQIQVNEAWQQQNTGPMFTGTWDVKEIVADAQQLEALAVQRGWNPTSVALLSSPVKKEK